MANLTMSQSWCSGTYSVSHSLINNGRTARITCTMHLWRNDGGRSYNNSASNNFYIIINGNRSNKTITSISGTTGVTVSHTVDVGLDNNGHCSVGVSVGGSISGSTFAITGNNSTTYTVANGSKASWTVSYNANGGTGAPGNQSKVYNTALTLSTTEPTRPGYLFRGWATSQTATEATYQPGDSYTANAALTLYAVWLIAEKIGLNITTKDLTIPSTSEGLANIPTLNLPFLVDYTSDNYTTDFYYKVCYVDNATGTVNDINKNSLGITHGPMNAKDISEAGFDDDTSKIPLTPELIKQSILNCGSATKVSFYVITSMTNDSFSDELSKGEVITLNIVNFRFLLLKILKLYKTSITNIHLEIELSYPGSYDVYPKPEITLKDENTSVVLDLSDSTMQQSSSGSVSITKDITVSDDTKSKSIIATVTDGISSNSVMGRVGTFDNQDILIYSNNNIEAVEFIESDYDGFEVGGKVISTCFIETENGGELIEL